MDKKKRIYWLKNRISSMEKARDEIPFGLIEDEEMELAAYKDSLASLTAECKYFQWKWARDENAVWTTTPIEKLSDAVSAFGEDGENVTYRMLFTAPPVPEIIDIESDVKNIIQLLSGREWAEHCTSTELGKELESQITDLYNEVSKIKLPDRDKLPGWARNHEDSLDWYESEIKRLNGLGE